MADGRCKSGGLRLLGLGINKDRCKGRVAGRRRMRWIIDERPFRCEDLDGTWWNWLKGVGLWDCVTGLDARSCGVWWV